MFSLSLSEVSAGLAAHEFSSEELTQALLLRIAQLNPQLNAVVTLAEESALQAARAADQRRAGGESGTLLGVPILHKDLFCTQGLRTSCGSRMLDNFIAPYDATVVARLAKAGMVSLGKTNMDEFAMGSSNENSFYGPVHNPWDLQRVPGGSSGGSAAAVAAQLVPAATGTDTGGSIRQPAALCGITGLKPTYGRVSRYGMIAFASSLDQAGVMARSAQDCAMVLQAMAGFDSKDSTSIDHPVADYTAQFEASLAGLSIGLPSAYFGEGVDPGVAAAVQQAIEQLRGLGVEFKPVELPNAHLSVPAYYVVAPAECSSNLSRFDGVRYGYRCENPVDIEDLYTRSRAEGFGAEVKRRILVGTFALSEGYADAYYLKAQQVRQLIAHDFKQAFEEVDLLLGPTSPTTAFKLGERMDDPLAMYLSDIFTIAANLVGLPGISVPCGFADGLPVGLQLLGPHFSESRVLRAAHAYQQVTDWHQQAPVLEAGA